jgi:predicted DNA-binding transcriptional regulator YafY
MEAEPGDGPFLISYLDPKGKPTNRWVTVTCLSGAGRPSGSITAYCYLRGERRTFSEARIASVTTLDGVTYLPKPGRSAVVQVLDPFRTRGPLERRFD